MDNKIPLLILQAVWHLHEQGIGSLRIYPGMNASGSAWRISIFNADDITDDRSCPEPADEAICVRYSSASGHKFAGVQIDHDPDAMLIASLILGHLPSLRPTESDAQYVRWYNSMMEQIRSIEDLPRGLRRLFRWQQRLGAGLGKREIPPCTAVTGILSLASRHGAINTKPLREVAKNLGVKKDVRAWTLDEAISLRKAPRLDPQPIASHAYMSAGPILQPPVWFPWDIQ